MPTRANIKPSGPGMVLDSQSNLAPWKRSRLFAHGINILQSHHGLPNVENYLRDYLNKKHKNQTGIHINCLCMFPCETLIPE